MDSKATRHVWGVGFVHSISLRAHCATHSIRLDQILCFSSADSSPSAALCAVAFGTADVAAATAVEISCHWSFEDSSRLLIVSGFGAFEEDCNVAAFVVVALVVPCDATAGTELVDAADTDAGAGTLEVGCREETRVLAILSLPLPYGAIPDADADATSFIVTSTVSTFGNIELREFTLPFLGPSGTEPYGRRARGPFAAGGVRARPRSTGDRDRELRPYTRTAAAAAYSRSRLIDRRPRMRCASGGDAARPARSRLSVRRRMILLGP